MNDDDLLAPKLSPPPASMPIVRGAVAAAAVVTVSLAVSGCSSEIGRAVFDAGTYAADAGRDAGNPGVAVFDAGVAPADAGNPGIAVFDAGVAPADTGTVDEDAGNPGRPAPDSGA